jgi:ABC-type transport system involved in cytochrome c biogenesis permease component
MTVLAVSTFLQALFAGVIVVAVTILWVAAVVDVVRGGASGLKIAGMLVLILILPVLGPLLYFAFRKPEHGSAEEVHMAQQDLHREAARRQVGPSV